MVFWEKQRDKGGRAPHDGETGVTFAQKFVSKSATRTRRATMWIKGVGVAIGLTFGLATGLAVSIPTDAQAQVKLAVGGPITGGSAAFGAQLKNGVEQAVEDINAAGGILGQKLTLSVGDDRADPKEGVSVANKFV